MKASRPRAGTQATNLEAVPLLPRRRSRGPGGQGGSATATGRGTSPTSGAPSPGKGPGGQASPADRGHRTGCGGEGEGVCGWSPGRGGMALFPEKGKRLREGAPPCGQDGRCTARGEDLGEAKGEKWARSLVHSKSTERRSRSEREDRETEAPGDSGLCTDAQGDSSREGSGCARTARPTVDAAPRRSQPARLSARHRPPSLRASGGRTPE